MVSPEVSILLPVYNGERYLADAVDSMLCQTFGNFELLAVNDGSSDRTGEILDRYRSLDARVRIVDNGSNLGLVASLNRGFDVARGEFIARMDADDVSFPQRLEKQIKFLRRNPSIGLCGSWFRNFGGGRSKIVRAPQLADDVVARLFFESPLGHPTVMFRRILFAELELRYREEFNYVEDYDLWVRAAEVMQLANISEVLLNYRHHQSQLSHLKKKKQEELIARIRLRQLLRIRPHASEAERELHLAILADGRLHEKDVDADTLESWLIELVKFNDSAEKGFPAGAFRRAIAVIWWRYCSARASMPGVLGAFYRSKLVREIPLSKRLGIVGLSLRGR